MPEQTLSIVVLPPPFGPSSAITDPAATSKADTVHDLNRAVARSDVAQIQYRWDRWIGRGRGLAHGAPR